MRPLLSAPVLLAAGFLPLLVGILSLPAPDLTQVFWYFALSLVLFAGAVVLHLRASTLPFWEIAIAIACGIFLTANAHFGGGPEGSEFIWLLALPLIYWAVTPDRVAPVLSCAVTCLLGMVLLLIAYEMSVFWFIVRTAESVVIGGIAVYATNRLSKIRRAAIQEQKKRVDTVKELEESEKKRSDAERFVSIGQLAAGVGHEVNNPLTYVVHNLELASESLREEAIEREKLELLVGQAHEGAKRIRSIVSELRRMSRPNREDMRSVDTARVAKSACKLLSNQIEHRAQLALEVDAAPPVLADPGRLNQVLVNLIANAVQAIEPGAPADNWIGVNVSPHGSDQVRIDVWDTGEGVSEANLSRIFDPSFTTRTTNEGTGLGLTITRGIVEEFGGHIHAEARVGGGTRFVVLLPQAEATTDRLRIPHDDKPCPRGKVLLVDDDPNVLEALERSLETRHEVQTLNSAKDALALIEAGAWFDVILCDLMMPNVDGPTFFRRLRDVAPQQARRVVFMTGGIFEPDVQRFLDEIPNARLDKPCSVAGVRSVVSRQMRLG